MRIGLHTYKSGSFERAALRAHEVGANTFQVFSTSPRMWRCSTPEPDDIRCLNLAREKHDLIPMVVHDSYLINLGSRDPIIRRQSIEAFRSEVERCIAIGAEYLVAHPGSYKGASIEEGMTAVVDGIAESTVGLSSHRLSILLENTVGAGAQLGSRFEELEAMRSLAQERTQIRLGFCLDTCHCLASGNYDVSTVKGLRETVKAAETILGFDNVHVIHTNDSKGRAGSRLDRHDNIGKGQIGMDGFRRILNHPELRSKAFILETPVDEPGDDKKDIEALKSLCRKR